MNETVDLINQSQVNGKLFSLIEIGEFQMFDELQIFFLFLLVLIVSIGKESDTEEEVEEVTTFGHVFFNVLDALV
jgi:hypothetical protein